MLTQLQLRQVRCFESIRVDFAPGFNFFIGQNGQGKTSILEAACVLLRLQSQRSSNLAPLIRVGEKSFAVAGEYAQHRMEFRYSALRRKIAFDDVEQRTPAEYLRIGRVVSLANTDIELVRGGSDARRRFLDFLGVQIEPAYRATLRSYERALRSRNALLKSAQPRPREIAAYDAPLVEHGAKLGLMRARLVERLTPFALQAHVEIGGSNEALKLQFAPGNSPDFATQLVESRPQEARLRQTVIGPHRDDIPLLVDGMPAAQYASEGQQRTIALALKIAQARVFALGAGSLPLLLIDDIFGELDPARRNRLLRALPPDAQKLVTATSMSWQEEETHGPVYVLSGGRVQEKSA
ncbi:MAG: DNA recombination and repair protein RecF [uncultured Chthoniobacterales bacterium]|uniref:DNA replication and repair protein RecF n=1 Tax=uncultured Chthoniobacterales bacterium TaxID=1836801 RepID=A0A6J4IG50_9BACT|nr:MAG: DNA recombination and repair protein RecF [uncultured Chthoniobacterales bacterium]